MLASQKNYFASQNCQLLYKILEDDINNRFQTSISRNRQCKQKLQTTMKRLYTENPNSELIDLNKRTILELAPIFYQMIQTQNIQTSSKLEHSNSMTMTMNSNKKDSASREREIFSRALPEFVDLRPQHNTEKNSIENNFKKLSQERQPPKAPTPPKFNDTSKGLDQELTPEEMLTQISTLQQQRELDSQKIFPDSKYKESDTPEFKKFQQQLTQFTETQKELSDKKNLELSQKIEAKERNTQELLSSTSNGGSIDSNNVDGLPVEKNISVQIKPQSSTVDNVLPDMTPGSTEHALLERNMVDRELSAQVYNPKLLQEDQQKFTDDLQQKLDTKDHIHVHEPGDHIQTTSNPTREVKYILEVNSMDRDISIHPQHRYNFQVSLGSSSDTWKRVPLYENSPTVPATKEQSERGERGFNNGGTGWRWGETGEQFPKYDPSKPPGNIVGYESIRENSTRGAKVYRDFKNVSQIELLQLVLPSEFIWDPTRLSDTTADFQNDLLQYPFLLVHIEELDGVYLSTNKNITTAFGKIVFEKDWSSDRSRYRNSFVRFGPSSKEAIKRFIPAPLASLNKLSISLLTPQGQRLQYDNDISPIKNIVFGDPPLSSGLLNDADISGNNRFIKITLKEYVNSQMFNTTRKINIREYSTILDEGEEKTTTLHDFESFIQRDQGHHIIATEASGGASCIANRMVDTIYIQSMGSVSRTSGLWVSRWSGDDVTALGGLLEDEESSGYVYNMTHQCHISFRITQLEEDVSNIPVKMV